MATQEELKAQLKELMEVPENMHCLDCDDKRPMWASLIVPPPNAPFKNPIGCFCCYQCSGAHRRMGVHICFVRSTNLDEWKEKELEAMREGGNKRVNDMFEANLSGKEKATVRPDYKTDLDARSAFIYDKYQHRKWYMSTGGGGQKKKSVFVPPTPLHETPFSPVDPGKKSIEEDFFASRSCGFDAFPDPNNSNSSLKESEDEREEIHYHPNEPMPPPKPKPPKPPKLEMKIETIEDKEEEEEEEDITSLNDEFCFQDDNEVTSPSMKSRRSKKSPLPPPPPSRKAPGRSKSSDLDSLSQKDRRHAPGRTKSAEGTPDQERRKAPGRTRSSSSMSSGGGSSEGGVERPRRRPPRRTPSSSSQSLGRSKSFEETESPRKRITPEDGDAPTINQRSSEEGDRKPRTRGVTRTASSTSDQKKGSSSSRARSKSVKRGVRRAKSSDGEILNKSLQSLASHASGTRAQRPDEESRASRASRRTTGSKGLGRASSHEEDETSSRRKDDDRRTKRDEEGGRRREGEEGRRRREGEDGRRRRTPPGRATSDAPKAVSRSCSPSPEEEERKPRSMRPKSRRTPTSRSKSSQEAPISVQRLPTVKDGKSRRRSSKSPTASKSPIRKSSNNDSQSLEAELLQALAANK